MNTNPTASAANWLAETSVRLELGVVEDHLDGCSVSGRAPVGSVPVAQLRQFADEGHMFEVIAENGSLSVSIRGAGPGSFIVDTQGGWEEAFEEEQVIEASNAAINNPEHLLEMCEGFDGRLTLTVVHPADTARCHWIRTTAALTNILMANDWAAALDRLLTGSPLTVIGDAGREIIVCGAVVIAGPEAGIVSARGDPDEGAGGRYLAALPQPDLRRSLPSPSQVEPVGGKGLDVIRGLLAGAASSLVWLWLGSSASLVPGPPRVRFDRALPLEADLPAAENQDASPDLTLWRWVISGDDMSRRDAAQQAVALIVRDASDLGNAAPRVLTAARFLHQASQRGLLSEALAARRSARDAVASATRTAADTARGVARSAFDRVLVQIAAAAGLLLAAKDDLLNFWVALVLGIAILALFGGTAAHAFGSDYRSASSALAAFQGDLSVAYGDALTPDDIAELCNMAALSDARGAINRSRRATLWTLAGAGLIVIGLLVVTLIYAN